MERVTKYLTEYEVDGKLYKGEIYCQNRKQAEEHLFQKSKTEKIVGCYYEKIHFDKWHKVENETSEEFKKRLAYRQITMLVNEANIDAEVFDLPLKVVVIDVSKDKNDNKSDKSS